MVNKKTRQKEAILAVLRSTKSHPTADWVYNEVKKEIPNISLGTVYRNLRQLCERGEIRELKLCDTLSRFDACCDDHYHFRCEKCGNIFDVNMLVNNDLNKEAGRETGFRITHHVLEFHGLCTTCQSDTTAS
jgi:Fur family peroxide stress response transcriptional regulator